MATQLDRRRQTPVIAAIGQRIGRLLIGILVLAAAARVAYFLLYFDRDWEYDAYAHVIDAKSIFSNPPESLWGAISWWSKPLYTLFFGSLYQLVPTQWPGLVVAQTTNVAFWLAASSLTLLVARAIFRHPLTVVVLAAICGFSFIAFRSSVSANTEPSGAFILALGLYFWHWRRWLAASFCFGLLPLVRTDSVFCVAIFGVSALLEAWRAPYPHRVMAALTRGVLIALPILLWHAAGFFHTGNFFSIETDGNLGIAAGTFGFGWPWDYAITFLCFDPVLFLCFVAGAASVLAAPRQASEVLLVSTLMAVTYFIAITALRTWGLFGAIGFIRYFVFAFPLFILVAGVYVDRALLHCAHSQRFPAEKVAAYLSLLLVLQLHWLAHGMVSIFSNTSLPPESELSRLPMLATAWGDKPIYVDHAEPIYYLCRGRPYCDWHPLAEIANPSAHGIFIFVDTGSENSAPGGSLSSFDGLIPYASLPGPYGQPTYIFER